MSDVTSNWRHACSVLSLHVGCAICITFEFANERRYVFLDLTLQTEDSAEEEQLRA